MTVDQQNAMRLVRVNLSMGINLDQVLPLVRPELQQFVREQVERERAVVLTPATTLASTTEQSNWLNERDRLGWYYWPELRNYLLAQKGWDNPTVRSIDDASDRVLNQLADPNTPEFDKRGLVIGYVQSGKTANFTALIAKAVDAGYRFVVVFSGLDNSLRRQTNIRLKRELVGYSSPSTKAVPLPPRGQQWHEFTTEDLQGDFDPGRVNHGSLQGSQPVLLVMKKNGPRIRKLLAWLQDAPSEVMEKLPILVIDDEADQASVDTRGTYQLEDDPLPPDYEPPAVINGLIRSLLKRFRRSAYVAYTATPFANTLIPHNTFDPTFGEDLFPRDFIIDLPKPLGYFGAEEYFGRLDLTSGGTIGGLDVVRDVQDADIIQLEQGQWVQPLQDAIVDFVLAGAARSVRGAKTEPATMLIHTSQKIIDHGNLHRLVATHFARLRDAWRYDRRDPVCAQFRTRWPDFEQVTAKAAPTLVARYDDIEPHIGPFLESVQVRVINSDTGEVLDYEREPSLKAIAIGGNRLSRGLTLEGLLCSFFIRRSTNYDTLMQMGRWFGYRSGYEDLTRIYTTPTLTGWFSDLALVEHRLREDVRAYELHGATPSELGTRILQHPTMQVTSRVKQRFARQTVLSQTYSLTLAQTFKFPLSQPEELAVQADTNLLAVRDFLRSIGAPRSTGSTPTWFSVSAQAVLDFLGQYRATDESGLSLPLIRGYIQRVLERNELSDWTIAVSGRQSRHPILGEVDLGMGTPVNQIQRSRLRTSDSLGIISEQEDEAIGLTPEQRKAADAAVLASGGSKSIRVAAREQRDPTNGLMVIYPISRHSGHDAKPEGNRRPLFANPNDGYARDLLGIALSFPRSTDPPLVVQAYLEGTGGWRLAD
jgi:hypothetical protein